MRVDKDIFGTGFLLFTLELDCCYRFPAVELLAYYLLLSLMMASEVNSCFWPSPVWMWL